MTCRRALAGAPRFPRRAGVIAGPAAPAGALASAGALAPAGA
jgi:hypothetical protein